MAVTADPKNIMSLIFDDQASIPKEITQDKANESLIVKITNFLYPVWLVQILENCDKYKMKDSNSRLFYGFYE